MRFEWDEAKNRRNLAKHKVSFETARSVFDDPGQLSVMIVVAHTWEEEASEQVVRLLSARKATAQERRINAENKKQSG